MSEIICDDCDIMFTVSIHVLRRGRCVQALKYQTQESRLFQSTSSEEDVVSDIRSLGKLCAHAFQSTSSEEDVVSFKLALA